MKLKSFAAGLYLGLSAICLLAIPAQAAPVTFNISGTFGSTFLPGSLSSASYLFPNLLGGSFSGSFTVDDAAPALTNNPSYSVFGFAGVDIDIVDNTNATIWNIDSGPNNIIVQDGILMLRFGESYLGDAIGNPEDLRLTFTESTLLGGSNFFNSAAMSGASFISGLSEVDAASGGYWDVAAASATIEGPPAITVAEPASFAVLGLGLAALALRRRSRRVTLS